MAYKTWVKWFYQQYRTLTMCMDAILWTLSYLYVQDTVYFYGHFTDTALPVDSVTNKQVLLERVSWCPREFNSHTGASSLLYVTSFGVWSPVSSPVVTSSIRVYCSKWSSLYSKSSIYFVLFVVVRVSFVKLAPPFLQCLFTVIHSHYGADCSLSIRPKKHTIL